MIICFIMLCFVVLYAPLPFKGGSSLARCSSWSRRAAPCFLVLRGTAAASWRSSSGSRASRRPRRRCGMQAGGLTGRTIAGRRLLGFVTCVRPAVLAQRLGLSPPTREANGSHRRHGFVARCRWALAPSWTGRRGCYTGSIAMQCEIYLFQVSSFLQESGVSMRMPLLSMVGWQIPFGGDRQRRRGARESSV
jgi:hypothetical protein